jgi:flagellin-like hook-associated protein FlgL
MSGMAIATNLKAINSHRHLGIIGNKQSIAARRLASGFRVNTAADDAAGLAISEKMRGQMRGLEQGTNNIQDGVNLIQTAEGAISTISNMVIRIRELVIQASNDTYAHENINLASSDRMQIQREINELIQEIDAVAKRVQFNTRALLDGRWSQFERFVMEEIVNPLLAPVRHLAAFDLLFPSYPASHPNIQWFNFIDEPNLRSHVVLELNNIDLDATAVSQLHGKSVIIGGQRFNFQNVNDPMIFPGGETINIIPADATARDFLLSLSNPNNLMETSGSNFNRFVNEVIITNSGRVEFRAPLRTDFHMVTADNITFPWGYPNGANANNRTVETENQPNLRRTDGTIGTDDVERIDNNTSVDTRGYFDFTLPGSIDGSYIYTVADIAALEADRGFRIVAPGLPDPFDVTFDSVSGSNSIPVWEGMESKDFEKSIVTFLNELTGFNTINEADIIRVQEGSNFTLRIPMVWSNTTQLPGTPHPLPPSPYPQQQNRISLTAVTDIRPSDPRHGWSPAFETGTTNPININPTTSNLGTPPLEGTTVTTINIPTINNLPAAFFVGDTSIVLTRPGLLPNRIGDPLPNPPPLASNALDLDGPHMQIQNPNNDRWDNINHIIDVPLGATDAEIQQLIFNRLFILPNLGSDNPLVSVASPHMPNPNAPSQMQFISAAGAPEFTLPTFTPATQVRHGYLNVDPYSGGNPEHSPLPSILRPNRTNSPDIMESKVNYDIGFNFTLATLGDGSIDFSYPGGINHTGFVIGGQTFEFYNTLGGTPPRHPDTATNVHRINLTPPMTLNEVRAVMETVVNNALGVDINATVVNNPIGSSTMRVNLVYTSSPVVNNSGTSNTNPPSSGMTARNGDWQFSGLFASASGANGRHEIGRFNSGQHAPRPQTRIDFGDVVNLLDFLPGSPEEGEDASLKGFTFFCSSCANEAFSVIFMADDIPDDRRPPVTFEWDNNGTISPPIIGYWLRTVLIYTALQIPLIRTLFFKTIRVKKVIICSILTPCMTYAIGYMSMPLFSWDDLKMNTRLSSK